MKKLDNVLKKAQIVVTILMWCIILFVVISYFTTSKNVSRETITPSVNLDNYYADLLYVEDVNYDTNTIMFKNSNDIYFIYEMETEIEDVYVGDFYNVVFYDNNTPEIADDEIINFRYERPDLYDYNEIYYNDVNENLF